MDLISMCSSHRPLIFITYERLMNKIHTDQRPAPHNIVPRDHIKRRSESPSYYDVNRQCCPLVCLKHLFAVNLQSRGLSKLLWHLIVEQDHRSTFSKYQYIRR